MVNLDDALKYLGFDDTDEMINANVSRALSSARLALKGTVGDDIDAYLPDDPRADELTLKYMADLYDNRGPGGKAANADRAMTNTLETQLRLELRRAREEGR